MPKLSDIYIDPKRFHGNGIRPWNDKKVVKPDKSVNAEKEILTKTVKDEGDKKLNILGNNKETIGKQLDNELGNNWETIRKQLGNKKNNNILSIGKQLGNNKETIGKQLGNNNAILVSTFQQLSGLQKKIFFYIAESCILEGNLTSGYITNETLRNIIGSTKTTVGTVKTTIQRLVNKNLISRSHGKTGRGGFYKFEITEFIKSAVLNEKHKQDISKQLGNNWETIGKQLGSSEGNNRETNLSSSGSNFLLKETTTTDDQNLNNKKSLSETWANLDISSLAKIGFTKTHLLQIAEQNKLTPEIVQQSIFAFAFDLEHNDKAKKIKGDPLNFIMGILRNGQPYAPPLNYESPENKAMRIYLERTKAIQERQQAMEKEIFDSSFSEWLQDLSVEKKFELLPDHVKGLKRDGGIEKVLTTQLAKSSLIEHFHKTIWEQKKTEILSSVRISQDK